MAGLLRGTMVGYQSSDPSEVVVRSEADALVRAVLAQLPRQQQAVLVLRQAGFSYGEIANTMGFSPKSVGTLLTRAEKAFRERYQVLSQEEDVP